MVIAFDSKADLKAIVELCRGLKINGQLLCVVLVGESACIQYNAHPVCTYQQTVEYFKALNLIEFAFITDDNRFIEIASEKDTQGQRYGCGSGCFLFRKP